MNAAHWLAAQVLTPRRVPARNYHDIDSECFGVNWPDDFPGIHGHPEVICYRGENYVPQQPTLRVRLHNWLIRVGERGQEHDDG